MAAAVERLLAATAFRTITMSVCAYIDGFNLYYGCLKNSNQKWLNIDHLLKLVTKNNTIDKIYYFTARVSGTPSEPGKPQRQNIYFRALMSLGNVEIVYGHFLSHPVTMPETTPSKQLTGRRVCVLKIEEKGSDVNLASYLLRDTFNDQFNQALVLTNDSDLATPVKMVRDDIGKRVTILNPHKYPARKLQQCATDMKQIRMGAIRASQFSPVISDSKGNIRKPAQWN